MQFRVLVVAFLAFCSVAASAAQAETETRAIGPIEAVVLAGAARLEITVGPPESLTLEGDPALLREVITEVRGNTLYVGHEAESWRLQDQHDRRLTVRVTLPRLTGLRVSGSSRASIVGLSGDSTSVTLRGSTQLHAQGALHKLALLINGSARADLSEVPVENAEVTIRGSGRAALQPRQSLTATIHGSGRVTYTGEPVRVTVDTHGAGRVERR